MPRQSTRLSSVKSTPTKYASSSDEIATPIVTRLATTPKKSKYFERDKEDEESAADFSGKGETSDDGEVSGYEDEDASLSEPSVDEDEDAFSDASDEPPTKKRRTMQTKSTPKSKTSSVPTSVIGNELWREGVKTGLGPGTQVVIEKPQARSAGKTPYKGETIHPNTMLFLADLAKHNDREWLKMHDPDFRTSEKDFYAFLECFQTRLIELDETIPELPLKDIIFRIYRDIRFSPDPTPYKAHFSAAWSRTGRKGPFAAYYLQIKPGGTFIGGGLWMPEAQHLTALRRNIDKKPFELKAVLLNSDVRKHFFAGCPNDEKKAVKAFLKQNSDNALKTKPKGFNADHADVDLLRLRNYTIGCKLPDEDVTRPGFIDQVSKLMKALVPLISHLNSVVMPDHTESSDDENQEASSDHEGDA